MVKLTAVSDQTKLCLYTKVTFRKRNVTISLTALLNKCNVKIKVTSILESLHCNNHS